MVVEEVSDMQFQLGVCFVHILALKRPCMGLMFLHLCQGFRLSVERIQFCQVGWPPKIEIQLYESVQGGGAQLVLVEQKIEKKYCSYMTPRWGGSQEVVGECTERHCDQMSCHTTPMLPMTEPSLSKYRSRRVTGGLRSTNIHAKKSCRRKLTQRGLLWAKKWPLTQHTVIFYSC